MKYDLRILLYMHMSELVQNNCKLNWKNKIMISVAMKVFLKTFRCTTNIEVLRVHCKMSKDSATLNNSRHKIHL